MQLFHKDFGYVDVIECNKDYSNNHIFIAIKTKNDEVKKFYLDIAYGKTMFLTDECVCFTTRDLELFFNGIELHDKLVEEYDFQGFMHQTNINNLNNIFKSKKLLSRTMINFFYDVANHDVLDHTNQEVKDCVRFYFYPKTPTNYNFEAEHPNSMVYLVFKWNIIHMKNAVFYNGNASSNYSRSMNVNLFLEGENYFMDWNEIFARDSIDAINEIEKWDIKRRRNAELNIPGFMTLKNLDSIYVKNINQYNIVMNILLENSMIEYLDRLVIKPEYFY